MNLPGAEGLIDLKRYPLDRPGSDDWTALVESCRAAYRDADCVNLPDFIRAEALPQLVAEAEAMLKRGYRKSHLRNALFAGGDPDKPADHPVNRLFREGSVQLADDQIGETLIRCIYEWQPLCDFVAAVEERPKLYRMADEFQALNIIAHETGDGLPWHFDVNDFTVTLLLQAAETGGEFIFVPELRDRKNVDFATMTRLFGGETALIHRTERAAGTLTLFRGRNALHAVEPVGGRRARITAILTFDEKPDCVTSPRGHVLVYGPRAEAIHRARGNTEQII